MTAFTPEAEARLEEYLRQVRAAVARDPEVSPDEIEADLREHVETEFHTAIRPVTLTEMEAVLVRLGPPENWATAAAGRSAKDVVVGDLTALGRWFRTRTRGVLSTLWRGPEDWRLAYLAFGLFCLGVLTAIVGIGVLFLLASYVMGRAATELAKEKGTTLGARRWLVYPGVLVVSVPLFLAVMLWPLAAAAPASEFVESYERVARDTELHERGVRGGFKHPPERVEQARRMMAAIPGPRDWSEPVAGIFAAVGALALWWTVVGVAMWAFPKWPQVVFHPLLDGYDGWHGVKLAAVAGVAFLIWLGFATRFAEAAGLT
ncbi:MAG TPA: hypothetical protein VM533_20785 [Fimbriiglobus sp.]|jgi:hypothetical protein|nr:hypothetical protein [Fimbriiglobus sp.]